MDPTSLLVIKDFIPVKQFWVRVSHDARVNYSIELEAFLGCSCSKLHTTVHGIHTSIIVG